MSSQEVPAGTLLDRLVEELGDDDFDVEKHRQTIMVTKSTDKRRYGTFVSALKKMNKREYNKLMSQEQAGDRGAKIIEMDKAQFVREVYPDAPVPDDAIIPKGWALRAMIPGEPAIVKAGGEEGRTRGILSHPMLVKSAMRDVDTGDVMIEIIWSTGGRWHSRQILKSETGSKTKFGTTVAGWGTEVHASNAAGVIEWISAYQSANFGLTDSVQVTGRLGWRDGGFTMPTEFIGDNEKKIRFVASDCGTQEAADAIKKAGSMRGWVEAIETMDEYPVALTGIYAALSSVLLQPLMPDGGNPIIDWSYRTSTGKTSLMQIASSAWGNQRDMLVSWNGTAQGLIGRAISMSHLPTILDDTKSARTYGTRSTVPDTIYMLAGGSETARNSTSGLQRIRKFRTTVLSSGEARAVDEDNSGGTVARVLSIWGAPFGEVSETTKKRLERIMEGTQKHYGHAGPAFVRYVVENEAKWPQWRERLLQIKEEIHDVHTKGTGISKGLLDRCSKIIALLQVTAEIAHECIPFKWPAPDLVPTLSALMTEGEASTDRELEALGYIYGRIAAVPGRIVSDEKEYSDASGSTSILGITDSCDYHAALFLPSLNRELTEGGYKPNAVLRVWRERKWCRDGTVSWLQGAGKMIILTHEATKAIEGSE